MDDRYLDYFLSLFPFYTSSICRAVWPSTVGTPIVLSLDIAGLRCVAFATSCTPLLGSTLDGLVTEVAAFEALNGFRDVLPDAVDRVAEAYSLRECWAFKVDLDAGRSHATLFHNAFGALDQDLRADLTANFFSGDKGMYVLDDTDAGRS